MSVDTRARKDVDFVPLLPAYPAARVGESEPDAGHAPAEGNAAADRDFFLSSLENEKNAAYLKGLGEGEKQTLASMSGKLTEQITRWTRMLGELGEDLTRGQKEFFDTVEERTVSVAVAIAEKLIRRELGDNPGSIRDRVREAITRLKSEPVVAVRANPKDAVFLRQLVHPGTEDTPTPPSEPRPRGEIELVEDPSVEAGGFVVETRLAVYDHTVSSLLQKIETDLLNLYERNDNPDATDP